MTDRFTITYDDVKHKYWIDGEEVPSVTAVIDGTMPKEALGWWSFRIGMAAIARLVQEGNLNYAVLQTVDWQSVISGEPLPDQVAYTKNDRNKKKPKTLLEAPAIDHGIHPNAIRDTAADQGTLIHDAITKVGIEGELPNLSDFADEQRGFILALAKWWRDQEPEFLEQEVIVGSKTHGYAGRFDLVAKLSDQRGMIDFKTSKAIRHSHHIQMFGYEPAYLECGGEPLDFRKIVRLSKDGTYEMVEAVGSRELFLAQLNLLKQLRPFYERFKTVHGRAT